MNWQWAEMKLVYSQGHNYWLIITKIELRLNILLLHLHTSTLPTPQEKDHQETRLKLTVGRYSSRDCCCCLPTPLILVCGGSPIITLLVHQPAYPSIWPEAPPSQRRRLCVNMLWGRETCLFWVGQGCDDGCWKVSPKS